MTGSAPRLLQSRLPAALVAAAASLLCAPALSAEGDSALTVYGMQPDTSAQAGGGGFALVSEQHAPALREGANRFVAAELPATLDPATAMLTPAGDEPGVRVLSSHWRPAASVDSVLTQHIGRSVSVSTRDGTLITGTLLAAGDGLLLRSVDGTVHLVRDYAHLQLPAQGPAPRPQPVLEWEIESDADGQPLLVLSYEVTGIGWWSEYQVLKAPGDTCRARIDGAALVSNRTGTAFEPARLWLVAGDVHRARARPEPSVMMMRAESAAMDQAPGVQRSRLGQYHRYDMGGAWELPAGGVTRLPLLAQARDVPCSERLVFHATGGWPSPYREPLTRPEPPGQGDAAVSVQLQFDNTAQTGLGRPLPAGRVRVVQAEDEEAPAQLLGEDELDHTPRGATVRLRLGDAFDVTGERRQADFVLDGAHRQMTETVEVTLSNARPSAVTVDVVEDLYRWTGWEITRATDSHQRLDAGRIRFRVEVPPDGTRVVGYTARYTW